MFDDAASLAAITKWVAFYKQHRAILSSDIIHVRRPDAQSLDAIMHVNPKLATKGLIVLFNPTSKGLNGTLPIDMYYTGLTEIATISEQGSNAVEMVLARDYTIELAYTLSARSITWFTVTT